MIPLLGTSRWVQASMNANNSGSRGSVTPLNQRAIVFLLTRSILARSACGRSRASERNQELTIHPAPDRGFGRSAVTGELSGAVSRHPTTALPRCEQRLLPEWRSSLRRQELPSLFVLALLAGACWLRRPKRTIRCRAARGMNCAVQPGRHAELQLTLDSVCRKS
jgi:hypothetical protein